MVSGGDPGSPGPGSSRDEREAAYTRHRARPRLFSGRRGGGSELDALRRETARLSGQGRRARRPITFGRVLRWVVAAIGTWLVLSVALFLISAQVQSSTTSDAAARELGGGFPLAKRTTILVLGSDARTADHAEPGAQTIGAPSRSDSILLIRTGGGTAARLSIPRDTVVDIPGRGRDKINAAYAIGGAALAVQTVERYLSISIDHLVEVDFANFPKLIDALGGIDYTGGCVLSEINGGTRNGGYTLRLDPGTTRLDGRQALALARTRHNDCNPRESDLTRARRQQKILAAMGSRLTSPSTFLRLPWVSWQAPRAIRSDMGGPTLLGLFGALALGGSPPTQVLKPYSGIRLADGGAGLLVSSEERRREVRRFLAG